MGIEGNFKVNANTTREVKMVKSIRGRVQECQTELLQEFFEVQRRSNHEI